MIKAVFTRDGNDIRTRKLSEFYHTELNSMEKTLRAALRQPARCPAFTDIRL